MVRNGLLGLWLAAGLALIQACEQAPPSGLTQSDNPLALQGSKKKLDPSICFPSQGGFTVESTNPYFPIDVGNQWEYEGEEDGESIRLLITVLDLIRVVDGVETRVLEEREFIDDELLEVSWNYLTETDGTLCYYGEDVDIFEDGIVHDGAWCAQDDPDVNKPGIFMPANPRPGMKYPIEIAPGIAEDQAKIIGIGPVRVPAGRFTETIRVEETTSLEPGKGYKFYASGTGLLIDGPVELLSFIQNAPAPAGPIPTDQVCGA